MEVNVCAVIVHRTLRQQRVRDLANKQCILFINGKMSHREDGNNKNAHLHRQRHHHQHERKTGEHSVHSMHTRNSRHTDPSPENRRVLRCFCGCSQLDFEQIEQFCTMSASAIVIHPVANRLFRNFLHIGHRTDKSNALLSLECHELCDKIINNTTSNNGDDDIDTLIELCPSFEWEEKVNDAIASDKRTRNTHKRNLTQLLLELKRECVHNIACHNDFDRFRKELLRKIGKNS